MCLLGLCLNGQTLIFKDDYENETTNSNEGSKNLRLFFFLSLDLGSTGFNEDLNLLIFISHVYSNLVPDVNVSEVLW